MKKPEIMTVSYKKACTVFKKPKVLIVMGVKYLSPLFSDEVYLEMLFFLKVGYKLDLTNPRTYNEKLQWLKLNYKKPELYRLVDKYEVKSHVRNLIGEEYIIPTLGVWDSFDEINFDSLPERFVLKTTHDQGGVVICLDKDSFDYKKARRKLNKHLKRNFFLKNREWPYKGVKPRIIAEEFMTDNDAGQLRDYKFFCFNGVPKMLYVASDRQNKAEGTKFDYFDLNFNRLNIKQAYPKSRGIIKRPTTFDKMVEFSQTLSQGFPHVRVDFYEIDSRLYFGELTFFHHSGLVPFHPHEWDYKLGEYLKLPN